MERDKKKSLPAKCKKKFGHLNLLFLCAIFIICGLLRGISETKICLGPHLTAASVAEVTRSNKMSHKRSQKARPWGKIKE